MNEDEIKKQVLAHMYLHTLPSHEELKFAERMIDRVIKLTKSEMEKEFEKEREKLVKNGIDRTTNADIFWTHQIQQAKSKLIEKIEKYYHTLDRGIPCYLILEDEWENLKKEELK
jgi:hypothetical protein